MAPNSMVGLYTLIISYTMSHLGPQQCHFETITCLIQVLLPSIFEDICYQFMLLIKVDIGAHM